MAHLGLDFLDSIAWAHDRVGLDQMMDEMSLVAIPVAGGVASAVYSVFATFEVIRTTPGVLRNIHQFGFRLPASRVGVERFDSFLAAHIVMSFHGLNFLSMGLLGLGYVVTELCVRRENNQPGYVGI